MSIAREGNVEFEGDYREETEGSQLIYDCIMDDDPRELIIQHWGGINTTVRALYSIYEDYHDTDQWEEVLAKVGETVSLSAGATDPDGNELTASWWIPESSCTYGKEEGDSASSSAEEAGNEEAEPAEDAESEEGESEGEEAAPAESEGDEAVSEEGESAAEEAPALSVSNSEGWETTITIPEDAQPGDLIVVNLEVQDSGVEKPMTRFAQFIITVE